MKGFTVSLTAFCALFAGIYAYPATNGDTATRDGYDYGRLVYNDNSDRSQENSIVYGRIVASENERINAAHDGSFDKLRELVKTSAEVSRNTVGSEQVRIGVPTSTNVRATSKADVTSVKNSLQDSDTTLRKVNARSVPAILTTEHDVRGNARATGSKFPDNTRDPFNPNGKPGSDSPSFYPTREQDGNRRTDVSEHFDRHSFRPSDGLFVRSPMGNAANPEIPQGSWNRDFVTNRLGGFGLPGRPIKRIIGVVLNTLASRRPKPTPDVNQQISGNTSRQSDKGYGSGSMIEERHGIQKSVQLGPLSVSLSVRRQ